MSDASLIPGNMNRLSTTERAKIIRMLMEGTSVRATSQMAGVSINTVKKLLVDAGRAAAGYHDQAVRKVRVRRLLADEIWCFVGAKEKSVTDEQKAIGWGDVWTWTAIDADTKLCVSYMVGGLDARWADEFMQDCTSRVRGRVQITRVNHRSYAEVLEGSFGMDVDYATLIELDSAPVHPKTRYSPNECIETRTALLAGNQDPKQNLTSYVGCPTRMGISRFTGLTNGFSKKVENHVHMVALHFLHYNFCRVHKTLRVTPAMQAGLESHVWTIEEMVGLTETNDFSTD